VAKEGSPVLDEQSGCGLTDGCALAQELKQLRQLFENRINESPFLGMEAAASFLCMTEESLRYYAERQRLLPYHVLGKGNWVFKREDLVKFIERFRRPGIDG